MRLYFTFMTIGSIVFAAIGSNWDRNTFLNLAVIFALLAIAWKPDKK